MGAGSRAQWAQWLVGTLYTAHRVGSALVHSGHSGLHSGQAADPSNDADRAIAERKTGAAIQLDSTKLWHKMQNTNQGRNTSNAMILEYVNPAAPKLLKTNNL